MDQNGDTDEPFVGYVAITAECTGTAPAECPGLTRQSNPITEPVGKRSNRAPAVGAQSAPGNATSNLTSQG